MTDTTQVGTSGGKLCVDCGASFDDDKRFKQCAACRDAKPPTEERVETASDTGVEPVFLDIEKHKPPPIEDRDHYWCGATHDCPMDIALGGFEFPKTIGRVKKQVDGSYVLDPDHKDGKIHRMTAENVALVKQYCANLVVRNFRRREIEMRNGGAPVVSYSGELKGMTGSKHRHYEALPDDKPLGQFVYMVKVRHGDDRPMSNPPTMVPRDW